MNPQDCLLRCHYCRFCDEFEAVIKREIGWMRGEIKEGGFVVVLGFYVPPTAKVIRRRDLGLKSHLKDWRSPGSKEGGENKEKRGVKLSQ